MKIIISRQKLGRRARPVNPTSISKETAHHGKAWTAEDRDRHRRRAGHRPGHRGEAGRRGRDRRRHRPQRGDRQGDRARLGNGAVGMRADVTVARVGRRDGRAGAPSSSAGSTCWSTTPAGTRPARSSTPTRPTGTASSPSTSTACCTPARRCCRSWPSRASGSVVNLALGRRPRRLVRRGRVLRGQGRGHRLHQGGGPRDGPPPGQRQLRLPRPDRHRAVRVDRRGQPEAARGADQGHPVPAARPARRTSPTPSRSSPPTRPPTSPARPSASAAASR